MSDKKKQTSSPLSMAVKVGVGVAAAAAAVGAGVALAKYLMEEKEDSQHVTENEALSELERVGRNIEREKKPVKERNGVVRNIVRSMSGTVGGTVRYLAVKRSVTI